MLWSTLSKPGGECDAEQVGEVMVLTVERLDHLRVEVVDHVPFRPSSRDGANLKVHAPSASACGSSSSACL